MEQAHALEHSQRQAAIDHAHNAQHSKGQPYCEDCGEAIPPERRQAHPAAIRCIACQGTFELFSKGHAR